MPAEQLRALIAENPKPEDFVRRALGLLEAHFRETALLALADWERLGVVSHELFHAVAGLQRPSWGSWNGLLAGLRAARRAVLRGGSAEEREKVERAALLNRILAALEDKVEPELAGALQPLGELARTGAGKRLRLGQALAMPISLRNRVAHDNPSDPEWWSRAADALRPIAEFVSRMKPFGEDPDRRAPWFLREGDAFRTFNGVGHDFAVTYVSRDGKTRETSDEAKPVLLAFQRLLGKADAQAADFRKLLAKLAPEEIKGVLLGDYLVGRPVGSGGFATVHVGRQLSTGRKVAVKILHDGMQEDAKTRFQQEAAFLSRFNHQHIVRVIGFGEEAWSAPRAFSLKDEEWFQAFSKTAPVKTYIAMEWVEGRTLDAVFGDLRKRKQEVRTVALWFLQAASALSAVHAAGLIHRDVKPSNLMLTGEGGVKLMDFGIARSQDENRTMMTATGHAIGTPAYMSPEQIRASDAEAEVGAASDVYSLCATFYEMFTGSRLFAHDKESAETVRTAKLSGQKPPRPGAKVSGLPWEIETILLGGLEPEISDRYVSMGFLERDIRRFLDNQPIEYRRPSLLRRMSLGYRRNRTVCNLVAAFAIVALAGVTWYVQAIRAEQRRTAEKEREARRNMIGLYVEQGRQELLAGRAQRAAVLLGEAYTQGGESAPHRYLLATALGPVEAEGPTLKGHTDHVQWAEFSPDDSLLATGSEDGTARLWDAKTGRPLHTLDAGPGGIWRVAFSPDGRVLGTASEKGAAKLWRASDGKLLHSLEGHSGHVGTICFAPDGKLVATAATDGTARVWDAQTGDFLFGVRVDEEMTCSATFSPDGKRLCKADFNGALSLWDIGTRRKVWSIEAHDGPVVRAIFSPDGERIATSSADKTVKIWSAESGELKWTLKGHTDKVLLLDWDPAGHRLVSCSFDITARVWDSRKGTLLHTLDGHRHVLGNAMFSPDGARIVTSSADGTARIWNAATGRQIMSLEGHRHGIQDGLFCARFSRDGTRVVTAGSDATAKLWNVGTGRLRQVIRDHTETVRDSAVSPDGKRFATVGHDGRVLVWDSGTGKLLRDLKADSISALSASFSPDGRLLVTIGEDGIGIAWDVETGGQNFTLKGHRLAATHVIFSPDGSTIATGSGDNTARIWDAKSGKELHVLLHAGQVHGPAYHPDGSGLVTPSADGTARVWDVRTGKNKATLAGHKKGLSCADWSPDGTMIATSAFDNFAKIWDAKTGRIITTLTGHTYAVMSVRFDPSSRTVLTGSVDGTAKMWEARTGRLLASMEGHNRIVYEAALSPDGSFAATAGVDGTARLWDPATGNVLAVFEGHTDEVVSVTFGPRSRMLITTSQDRTARVWNIPREERPPAEVAGIVNEHTLWRLREGSLVPKPKGPD